MKAFIMGVLQWLVAMVVGLGLMYLYLWLTCYRHL